MTDFMGQNFVSSNTAEKWICVLWSWGIKGFGPASGGDLPFGGLQRFPPRPLLPPKCSLLHWNITSIWGCKPQRGSTMVLWLSFPNGWKPRRRSDLGMEIFREPEAQVAAKINSAHFSAPILQVKAIQGRLSPSTPYVKSITCSHLAWCEMVRKIFPAP